MPGLTSALGCVLADLRHDFVHTLNAPLRSLDPAILAAEMRRIEQAGQGLLAQAGVTIEAIDVRFELDMAYEGQSHAVAVGLDDAAPTREDLTRAFDRSYRLTYGRTLDAIPVNVLTLRAAVIGRRPAIDLGVFGPADAHSVEEALVASRQTWTQSAWRETPVYERLRLPAAAVLEGPCLLRQPDTTILVEPGMRARTDELGNVFVEVSAA
jgi:N-methylhydantoinase A